jgi:predicted dehydrogenase
MKKIEKFLVVGLGSMGKRRIRNLQALGCKEIAGFDLRQDRVDESISKYKIRGFKSFDEALKLFNPSAVIISTSPKYHMDYAFPCEDLKLPTFIEASVTDSEKVLALSKKSRESDVIIAPSCTMLFHPGPKKIKELLTSDVIGTVLNINYHTGQFLPDWHPWEDISEYYVSDPETGGAREIVPFELTWLVDLFGKPKPLSCFKEKLSNMNAPIDDIYHCMLRFPANLLCNLTIEVLSRPKATRELRIIGSKGLLLWSGEDNVVLYITSDDNEWKSFNLYTGTIQQGYINPEEPYIEEIKCFVEAAELGDQSLFPNNLDNDHQVLETLISLERLTN